MTGREGRVYQTPSLRHISPMGRTDALDEVLTARELPRLSPPPLIIGTGGIYRYHSVSNSELRNF